MTTACPRCGRPVHDAPVCRPCGQDLARALNAAAGHAEDAHGGTGRQAGAGGGSRSAYGEAPIPDLRRSATLQRAAVAAGGWERVLTEEGYASPRPYWRPAQGPLCPPPRPGHLPDGPGYRCGHRTCDAIRDRTPPTELAQVLGWLAGQTEQLRRHPDAPAAFRELHDTCAELERLVDRPPSGQRLVGMCDCGQTLYAPHGRDVVKCKGRERSCGAEWNVDESQEILLRHLDGKLVTVSEALDMAGWLDVDRTREQIRKLITGWVRTGQLAAHGHVWRDPTEAERRAAREAGEEPGMVAMPLHRFGEIRARLAATPRRKHEGAAA